VDRGIHLVYFNKLLHRDKAGPTALLGLIALRDTDVSIGQVMPEALDIVQAFIGVHPGDLLSPIHLDRLEWIPGSVPRREIGSRRIGGKAEDPARASKGVNLHLQSLRFALGISEMAAEHDESSASTDIGRYLRAFQMPSFLTSSL
jgi:hypothetical protein